MVIFLFSLGFGILMEFFQEIFTTYRTYDNKDIFANALGSVFGIVFAFLLKKYLKKFFIKIF